MGPQFFGALRKEDLNYLMISLVVVLAGLATAILLGKALHFDKGTTAGLFAGAMTQSAVIGTADGAVDQLAISATEKKVLYNNIAVSYAITYLFGVVGVILFFKLLPGLMRINLKRRGPKAGSGYGRRVGAQEPGALFLVKAGRAAGLRSDERADRRQDGQRDRKMLSGQGGRLSRQALRENYGNAAQDMIVECNDVPGAGGKHVGLACATESSGVRIDITTVIDMIRRIPGCLRAQPGRGQQDAGRDGEDPGGSRHLHDPDDPAGTRDYRFSRIPSVNKNDIMHLVGSKADVERAAQMLGYPERPTAVTDLVMVGVGCVLGTLAGMIVIPIAGIPLTLGTGEDVLVARSRCSAGSGRCTRHSARYPMAGSGS